MTKLKKAVRFGSAADNPKFPLPPDYDSLTEEGKRLARVNACCLQETPHDFVTAWDFFRRTYLFPTPPGFFYSKDLVESPPLHYQMIGAIAEHRLSIGVCPRGFGKSTLLDEIIQLLMLTQPGFIVGLFLSVDTLVTERGSRFQQLFTENDAILNDFGNLKPGMSKGKWNEHSMHLTNLSRIQLFPVEGRKRGMTPRPHLIGLDDPEYDPKGTTDTHRLRQDFEWLLFRVLFNMGIKGAKILWLGTMISKQSSLWAAYSQEDSRFDYWHRELAVAIETSADGEQHSSWDEMWSLDDLEQRKREIGPAAFTAEFQNAPGEGEGVTFDVHPKLNIYKVDGDESYPLSSAATMSFYSKSKGSDEPVPHRETWGEFVSKLYRIMLMDYAPTATKHSDYSALSVIGFERPIDVLWLLDCWVGRVTDEALIHVLYRKGQMWLPRIVGIEAVSLQHRVVEMAASFIQDHAADGSWFPRVVPIRYPHVVSKTSRIAGIQWRFPTGRIKLPGHRRNEPSMRMLFQQIEEFNAESRDGNLRFDDALDSLSMYQEITRQHPRSFLRDERRPSTYAEKLQSGQLADPATGIPHITGLRVDEISSDFMAQRYADTKKTSRPRPSLTSAMERANHRRILSGRGV